MNEVQLACHYLFLNVYHSPNKPPILAQLESTGQAEFPNFKVAFILVSSRDLHIYSFKCDICDFECDA